MSHKKFETQLLLSVNRSLDAEGEAELARHLSGCDRCRNDRIALEKLDRSLTAFRAGSVPDESLLEEARRDLHALLLRELSQFRHALSWNPFRSIDPRARLSLAATFVLVLTIGLAAGKLVWVEREGTGDSQVRVMPATLSYPKEGETRITNLQFIDRGEKSGSVEFTFDAVTPVRMRGTVDDPAIQKLLVRAVLHDENPGVRLTAMNAIGAVRPLSGDEAIESGLIKALRSDPNVGVRKQALAVLHKMPLDEQIKQAFLQTLMSDKNPGLRVAAINALDETWSSGAAIDQNIRDVLQQKAISDNNDYVRLKAKAVLLEKR